MPSLAILEYSDELQRAILIAQSIAREHHHSHYGPAHLLQGVLHDDVGLSTYMVSMGKDIHYLRDWANIRIRQYAKSARVVEKPPADTRVSKTLEVADVARLKLSLPAVSPFCALIALSRPGVAFEIDQLSSFPITEKELLSAELSQIEQQGKSSKSTAPSSGGRPAGATGGKKGQEALERFCINLTQQATDGRFDPIIGRDREISELAKILGRRTKPNVIIVGEPGVGKTALVEGFAQNIVAEQVPSFLFGAEVLELDVGALIAGASYKGEVEDRIKAVIQGVKSRESKTILFIDEIHVLLDPKGGSAGIANLLKPELARGELTVIGATTFEEFQKYIEKDDAFNRRFAPLHLQEPSVKVAMRMLRQLAPRYEEHHAIQVTEGAVREAVLLARRYLRDRQLPDAAIDLMDRTMAATAIMKDATGRELAFLSSALEGLMQGDYPEAEKHNELYWVHQQLLDKISPILIEQIETQGELDAFPDSATLAAYLRGIIEQLQALNLEEKEAVEASDIAAAVSVATGIPMGKLQADERSKLAQLGDRLKSRVIGQDHAVLTLVDAINISRAGLADEGRPVGAFFFLGPTGTGKTELAKALADNLFNDERALIRFDMSEFTEKHTAQFLIGAPPGYVGYEEGGALVNAIRQRPYAIILFDEIEKAHPEVFKTFLQVLDDGKLTDKLGKEGDFTNAIILFTSNIGSEYIVEQFSSGTIPEQQDLIQDMSRHFKDEFLGRLTEIIPFAPITEENIGKIFLIQLKRLQRSLEKRKINLTLSDEALHYLSMKGFSPRFGARPLRRVIMNDLQKPLAKKLITGVLNDNQTVHLEYSTEQGLQWQISANA